MRSSFQLRLLLALTLLPVVVATVLTITAIRLFQSDKELYVYDLSTQNADLLARMLATKLSEIEARAALPEADRDPLFATLERKPAPDGNSSVNSCTVRRADDERLRVSCQRPERQMTLTMPASALLDLAGAAGPTGLALVNDHHQLLAYRDAGSHISTTALAQALERLRIFGSRSSRIGSTELSLSGRPTLVSYARATPSLAVVLSIPKAKVMAAATPLVASAAAISLVTVIVVVLLALLVGRRIAAPLRQLVNQAEAIGRGEFGGTVDARASGELARLLDTFNEMSTALARRQSELDEAHHQLLRAERHNTATRMMAAVVSEVSAPLEAALELANESAKHVPTESEARQTQLRVVTELNRAANVLQNLKRIATERYDEPVVTDADLVLSDVLVSARPLLSKHSLAIEVYAEENLTVYTKPDELQRALLDLLLFVSERASGDTVKITLEQARDGNTAASDIVLDISYRGTTLSHRLYDPLQAQPSTDLPVDAMLSLSVAATVLREQGGQLTLHPTEGGNSLRCRLPGRRT